ncbi:cilia- and flagella-associated protein 206 isoform X1 [Lampris incognitus]|uniref:cilia- and flagella-associated protein 206 isoform X1 n=1 Tax=Lampris incognitus TaxID=2546036 RepID=UPI0024B5FDED|nr:cilia- and flagella-associated protein 206 isoform X1 [Lampris incognitus]
MSRTQAGGVIKSIVREIAQECAMRGHAVSETLAAFMVKAVVLDPKYEFNVDRTLTKHDVGRIVELCVEKLMEECSPALETIKMQVYFDMNYTSRGEFIKEHHWVLLSKLSLVCQEITDSRVKTQEELEGLYRKIVGYILLRSGVGSPTDTNTVREATAALQSVFPQPKLQAFMSLMKRDKEQQLSELTTIVTGIRLFNKYSEKGGEGIDDLPLILNDALLATSKSMGEELNLMQRLVWKYTASLEKLVNSEKQAGECSLSPVMLKQALYNVRQHEAFLKIIMADVSLCATQAEFLGSELNTHMNLLRETVHCKTAVPTAQVFPLFTALAKLWSGFQDELALLKILANVVENLRPFLAAQSQIFPEAQLEKLLEGSEVKSDEQRMAESSDDRIDPFVMKTQDWVLPETTVNFDKLPLQYEGICGYTLVEKDGLLLPGNPSIGVLKHKEKFYAFNSKDAAQKFASCADEFIERVAETARRSPELIQLLQLHQQFACITPYSEMQSGERFLVKAITKCDSCTQTDTHPVEKNIVKSYEWNEWELRRKAIKLANLRTRVTHSMQTKLSHLRRDNATQTYLPKDAACQSKRDTPTNTPKPQVYLAGLRGDKTAHMVKTELTRPIDE